MEEFLEAFLADRVIYCPFWDHVLKFWNARDSSNILFLKYEDMKEDLLREIRRTERFLDVTIPPGVEKELLDHLSFERMKKNPSVNYDEMLRARDKSGALFMRRGESGRWAQEMSPYFAKTFDAWAAQRLRGTNFPYYS
ncbi:hypothetical protein AAG570_008423 [Ranatra chinensis]|uniref:Sulfotransferase domain-containing protein n=1 Tax=Ranatra chinensis TaxID=642074 RepID=A0ABD0ZE65_9HEMI